MTTQTSTYDQPSVWAPLLIEWAERGAEHFTAVAHAQRSQSFIANATAYEALAAEYREIAHRVRVRLLETSGVLLSDVADVQEDEPPSTLVGLVDWLRGKIGHYFPFMPPGLWQGIGYVLHAHRRQS